MKIDCIIPLYNKKNFILNSVNSALNQKLKKFNKILIINDGSTDGGDLFIDKIFKNNNNVEIINQNNSGASEARNKGIKLSEADFVVFLDADDQLHEKYLICLHMMLSQHPNTNIFSAQHFNIFKNIELIKNTKNIRLFKSKIIKLNDPILKYSFNQRIFCSSGICIKRNLIKNNLFPKNINVGEDIYTWLKLFKENHLVYYDAELIFIFKISENRSIELFKEIPFYLKKINEFQSINKMSFKIYFFVSSLIFLYQVKKDHDLYQLYLSTISRKSKFYYFILNIFDNIFFYNLYKKFKYKKDHIAKTKKNVVTENFLLIALNYFLTLPSIPIIILVLYFTKKYEIISEILIISSLSIMLTSSISFYARPLALIKNQIRLTVLFVKLKKILFLPLLIILIFITFFLGFINFYTVFIGIFFILYIWNVEASIALYELSNSKTLLLKNFIQLLTISLVLILTVLYDYQILKYTVFAYLVFINLSNIFFNFKIKKLKNFYFYLKKIYEENLYLVLLNSITVNFTNFLHRYLILFYVEKSYAGILFFIYSMGSFPSNLFSYVFSATLIRNKISLPYPIIIFTLTYIAIFAYFAFIYFFEIKNAFILNYFLYDHIIYILFSMIGGFLMSYAILNKNKIFNIKNSLQKIFNAEITYSFFIILLVPIFYKYLGINSFGYLFFVNSLSAALIFTLHYKIKKNV